MRVAVCIVMVPKIEEVFVHRTTGELRAVPAIINPADENALEMALQIKDSTKSEVAALNFGGEQSEGILRKAVAMGCDHAYHVVDSMFSEYDSSATARVLGAALQRIRADVVLLGSEALNGGQTGPRIAEMLDCQHVIEAKALEIGDPPRVKRSRDGKEETVAARTPAVITVLPWCNTPRTPKAVQIMKAHREGVLTRWTPQELGLDELALGKKGSCTRVVEVF